MDLAIVLSIMSRLIVVMTVIYVLWELQSVLKSIKSENRIARYSLSSKEIRLISLSDKFYAVINKVIKEISLVLGKSLRIKEAAKYYNKYIRELNDENPIDYLSKKILFSLFVITLYILVILINNYSFNTLLFMFILISSYYLLDIRWMILDSRRCKIISEELHNVVMIMNSAIKVNYSLVQALYLVPREIDDELEAEFKIIKRDLKYGLSFDLVMDRFCDRVDTSEVREFTKGLVKIHNSNSNLINNFDEFSKSFLVSSYLEDDRVRNKYFMRVIAFIFSLFPVVLCAILYFINNNYFNEYLDNDGSMALGLVMLLYFMYLIVIKQILGGHDE